MPTPMASEIATALASKGQRPHVFEAEIATVVKNAANAKLPAACPLGNE